MIAIGYYTPDRVYGTHVELLKKSLIRQDIGFDFKEVQPGAWLDITALKPQIILAMLHKHKQPVLYLDVDAVVHKGLADYFTGKTCDLAVYYKAGTELLSGTLYFNYCEATLSLIEQWIQVLEQNPTLWDQKALQQVLETHKADVEPLPVSFTYIFDTGKKEHPTITPIVEHLQASREGRHQALMTTWKYRLLSALGLYPRSTYRLRARRKRLAELSDEYGVEFRFGFKP